jgi:peptidoglycan/LPS O-acetylase OafA/YrhL
MPADGVSAAHSEAAAAAARDRSAGGPQVSDASGTGIRRPPRLPALDGLRGVAALVVLVFHVLILSETFAAREPGVRPHEASWWVTHTPLSLLWAGEEAVFLFFVLSGFVLALPTTTTAEVRWRAYYPQRLLRLYLPVWASLLFAAALVVVVPRGPQADLSGWYAAHVPVVGPPEAVRDGLLLFGAGWLNSPLWSLQWEVLFSLLLPVYVVLARWRPRLWAVKALGLFVLLAAALVLGRSDVMFLSMFAFGVLLAYERERLAAAVQRVDSARLGWLFAGLCALLITVDSVLLLAELDRGVVRAAARCTEVLGACFAVVLALHWEPARRCLSHPWAQWVGTRSFSLYLVHEPIVVSSAALWPGLPVLAHLAVVLPVSLLAAHGFHRAVEAPAHRLSRAAARAMA